MYCTLRGYRYLKSILWINNWILFCLLIMWVRYTYTCYTFGYVWLDQSHSNITCWMLAPQQHHMLDVGHAKQCVIAKFVLCVHYVEICSKYVGYTTLYIKPNSQWVPTAQRSWVPLLSNLHHSLSSIFLLVLYVRYAANWLWLGKLKLVSISVWSEYLTQKNPFLGPKHSRQV